MEYLLEVEDKAAYLASTHYIDWQHPLILAKAEELCEKFPGLDCGSCGAPTCKALAEDIVRGKAREHDCIHVLKKYIHHLSDEFSKLDGE